MPKVSWLKEPKPKINYLAALFLAYRKARNITCEDVGKAVGCSAQNAAKQMNKPGPDWKIGQLVKYCDALGIPYIDALEAAIK